MTHSKTDGPISKTKFVGAAMVWTVFVSLTIWGLGSTAGIGSSLIYKNYIVRYDRGWDILCEPYVVQKNDWVLKIFRQKGEIAHQDFRDFLGIFQRLNPHIKNINMIRPGQAIDIPLRKLEHGSLPGQASGVVTIPFVTLAQVEEVLHQHSQSYQIQRGDTVSQLIARRYGRYGSRAYKEGIKLFQGANPQITDLNRIFAGQRVYLPDPAIRDQAWYASLYDEQGNLREAVDQSAPAPPAAEPAKQRPPVLPAPEKNAITYTSTGPLAEAAATVGGKLMDKGTYYVPRQGADDFEIDLSRHPLLDLQNDTKILFSSSPQIMDVDRETFQIYWPEAGIVDFDDQSSVEEIIASVFAAIQDDGEQASEVGFEDRGVQVTVRAKWVRPQSDQRHLCITPINDPSEQTPEAIRRYLEQNGIVLKEVLPGGNAVSGQAEAAGRHAVKNILALTPTSQKDFVQHLSQTLGFRYTPNVGVTFPYAGIQVEAYANLLSTNSGEEVLVDFGDLYGDAVAAIRRTGLQVVQITAEDSYNNIVRKLMAGLKADYVENPTYLSAQRPAQYNTAITVRGVVYRKGQDQQILLSAATLHPAVTDLLSANGLAIVQW